MYALLMYLVVHAVLNDAVCIISCMVSTHSAVYMMCCADGEDGAGEGAGRGCTFSLFDATWFEVWCHVYSLLGLRYC